MKLPASDPRVAGFLFASRFEYIERRYGPDATGRVLAALEPVVRDQLLNLDALRWYPLQVFLAFDKAVGPVLAPGEADVHERLASASVQHLHGWLGKEVGLMSVHGLLSRIAEDHPRYFSFGCGEYRRTGFESGELAFSDYPVCDEVLCRGARGYFKACLDYVKARQARVDETECQCRGSSRCLFQVRWQGRGD